MTFSPITRDYPLVLASSSPRRKALLEQIGLPFRILPSHVDEEGLAGDPSLVARQLAEIKAREVHLQAPDAWVLGADTIVVLGADVLGKPAGPEEARSMLIRLSGKEHQVVTAFSVLDPSGNGTLSEAVSTQVKMKRLTEEEITAYIATGEPFGKAGGYAIQGIGAFMIETISGSYTNVVGLPLCALIKALLSVGALRTFPFDG
ncbi:MAG: nucleoside triphosphate pyrophosphatase [Pseudomonadota bacterium]